MPPPLRLWLVAERREAWSRPSDCTPQSSLLTRSACPTNDSGLPSSACSARKSPDLSPQGEHAGNKPNHQENATSAERPFPSKPLVIAQINVRLADKQIGRGDQRAQ